MVGFLNQGIAISGSIIEVLLILGLVLNAARKFSATQSVANPLCQTSCRL
jgi:hypothetical protein